MDAYLDRIAPEKLTVLCASGFFLDDRRLTFIDEYGAELSIEEVEENNVPWLKRQIGDASSRRDRVHVGPASISSHKRLGAKQPARFNPR
jgi:hypothetical protein